MAPSPKLALILGGTRSGKSLYGENLLAGAASPVYLATGQAGDAEMAARIALHRQRRGPHWQLVEEPLDLAGALTRHAAADRPVLVDCLTLWLGNLMVADRDLDREFAHLLAALPNLSGQVVMVSNEVGLGIVPDNALARRFRDQAGILHQAVAALADHVAFIAAGLPMILKDGRQTD